MRAVVAGLTLAACGVGYGADFDYPEALPVPPGATAVAEATGWDDDDPMRGREVVIDLDGDPRADLLAFYTERFPSAEGWLAGAPDADVGGDQLLCLVSHEDDRFDEYVEVHPYDGGSESAGPGRYLVSVSRLSVPPGQDRRTVDRCGLASIWFPPDL